MLEVYNVMVRLFAHDGVSRVIGNMGKKFAKTDLEAKALQTRLDRIKTTMLAGAGLGMMGFFGIRGLNKLIAPAAEYQHLLVQSNAMGLSHLDIVKNIQAAWETTTKVQTMSLNQAYITLMNLRAAVKSLPIARAILPDVAKLTTVMAVAQEQGAVGRSETPEQMSFGVVKTLEMLGKTGNVATFRRNINEMASAILGLRGVVTPRAFQMTAKYAKAAGPMLSERFMYTTLPVLMQEMMVGKGFGGARGGPGAAIAGWYRFFGAGVASKKELAQWGRLGLLTTTHMASLTKAQEAQYKVLYKKMLTHPYFVPSTKAQENLLLAGAPIKGAVLAIKDPLTYMGKYILPAIHKLYPHATQQTIAMIVGSLLPGRGGWLASTLAVRYGLFEHYRSTVFGKVRSISDIVALSHRDPWAIRERVSAQWSNIRTVLGAGFMTAILPALDKFANVLNQMAQFFKAHPLMGKNLIISLYGLAAAMGFSGVVLLLTGALKGMQAALFGGGLATGVTEIALALMTLYEVVKHWHDIIGGFKGSYYLGTHPRATEAYYRKYGWRGVYRALMGESPEAPSGVHVRHPTAHKAPINIVMDGRVVGKMIGKHIGKEMSSTYHAHSPLSTFDPSLNLPGVAYNP